MSMIHWDALPCGWSHLARTCSCASFLFSQPTSNLQNEEVRGDSVFRPGLVRVRTDDDGRSHTTHRQLVLGRVCVCRNEEPELLWWVFMFKSGRDDDGGVLSSRGYVDQVCCR